MRLISRVNSNIQSLNGDQLLTKLLTKYWKYWRHSRKIQHCVKGFFHTMLQDCRERGAGEGVLVYLLNKTKKTKSR